MLCAQVKIQSNEKELKKLQEKVYIYKNYNKKMNLYGRISRVFLILKI